MPVSPFKLLSIEFPHDTKQAAVFTVACLIFIKVLAESLDFEELEMDNKNINICARVCLNLLRVFFS